MGGGTRTPIDSDRNEYDDKIVGHVIIREITLQIYPIVPKILYNLIHFVISPECEHMFAKLKKIMDRLN